MQIINERVGIEVRFGPLTGVGSVLPTSFEWRGRQYRVQRVTMVFERRDGGRRYMCFIAQTGGMLVELVLDRENLSWRIGKCEPSYT